METERSHPERAGASACDPAEDPCDSFALALRRQFGTPGRRPPRPAVGPARGRALLCPSAPAEIATLTIGRRHLGEPFDMTVQHGTSQAAEAAIGIERFACHCVTTRCGNWRGYCCLGAAVTITGRSEGSLTSHAEPCGIADVCRWFQENGAAACRGCRFVVRGEGGFSHDG